MNTLKSELLDIEEYRLFMANVATTTLAHFRAKVGAQIKSDGSPLTQADLENHDILCRKLPELIDVPVLSEEAYPDYGSRKDLREYWLIDPIDGTKEFIAGIPEFCVLVALIRDRRPIFGSILLPANGQHLIAEKGQGVHLSENGEKFVEVKRKSVAEPENIIALTSRFDKRIGPEYTKLGVTGTISCGSAMKYCSMLQNESQIYFRSSGPHEWDVAAGDLLLHEAGGSLIGLRDGSLLRYNQEGTRVDSFLAMAPSLVNRQNWLDKFRSEL